MEALAAVSRLMCSLYVLKAGERSVNTKRGYTGNKMATHAVIEWLHAKCGPLRA
jgi:hypothetical protein